MADETIVLTDPARELAELCDFLQVYSGEITGETYLAKQFGVTAWSAEFFQILFAVSERCLLLRKIVSRLDLDDDFKRDISAHIDQISAAFSADSMKNRWHDYGVKRVGAVNVQPLKALSGMVRQQIAYRKLTSEEIDEVAGEVATLLKWLNEHQLSERDFIRQAIIDGLEHFQFRLQRLKWLGWGYTLESLREVIGAYMLLERGLDEAAHPDAAAVLKKVATTIQSVYGKVASGKKVFDTGDWLLRAYGAASLYIDHGSHLAGLLK